MVVVGKWRESIKRNNVTSINENNSNSATKKHVVTEWNVIKQRAAIIIAAVFICEYEYTKEASLSLGS